MVSQINFSSIDSTYPIAGKDNDTQGFRDNFGYIKEGLQIAQGELTSLQNNSALTNTDNNFNNNTISGAVFNNNSDLYFDGGTIASLTTVTYGNGPYQRFSINSTLTLTLSFPTTGNQVYRLRVELIGNDSPYTVSFGASNGGTIIKSTRATSGSPVIINSSETPLVVEFWTHDSGQTVFMDYLGFFS
jgi:hypothetical protein